MDPTKELSLDEMETIAGGVQENEYLHDLGRFVLRTVCNVIHYDDTSCLPLQRTPGGAVIPGIGWQNGEPIMVHGQYMEDGWYFACRNGSFGYVNPNNVR